MQLDQKNTAWVECHTNDFRETRLRQYLGKYALRPGNRKPEKEIQTNSSPIHQNIKREEGEDSDFQDSVAMAYINKV